MEVQKKKCESCGKMFRGRTEKQTTCGSRFCHKSDSFMLRNSVDFNKITM